MVETWQEYQRMVLSELERNNREIEKVREAVSRLKIDIETLKIKAGLWGVMGSSIPVIAFILYESFKK